ncbi:hypothetical protein L0F63_000392, partial [Massospora cicadina]
PLARMISWQGSYSALINHVRQIKDLVWTLHQHYQELAVHNFAYGAEGPERSGDQKVHKVLEG